MVHHLDADAIHGFRMTYKKLRAFLRMVSLGAGPQKIKMYPALNEGYHIAGQIRDMQLEQLRISKTTACDDFQGYTDLLQKKIDKLWKTLSKAVSGKNLSKCRAKTMALLPIGFSLDGCEDFIRQKWKCIHSIVDKGKSGDGELRSIRKNLKDLVYVEGIKNDDGTLLPPDSWNGKSEGRIAGLLCKLGNFEDKCKSLKIAGHQSGHLGKHEKRLVKKEKLKSISEKREMKRLLVLEIKKRDRGPEDCLMSAYRRHRLPPIFICAAKKL